MRQLSEVKKEIEVLKEAIKKIGEDALKGILDEYPNISAICWSQYIPYFNDGDPCEFTLGEIYILSGEVSDDIAQKIADNPYYPEEFSYGDLDDDDDEVKFKILQTYGNNKSEDAAEITSFMSSIDETLHSLYGSYASIVMTRKATLVENFEPPC